MGVFDEYGAPNQPLNGQERILLAQTQGAADVTTTGTLAMVWTYISNIVQGIYAPLVSPALQGTPTAPTAPIGTATQQIATTAFVAEGFLSDANAAADYAAIHGSAMETFQVAPA